MLICPIELCNHCGACEAICPVDVIEFDQKTYVPQFKNIVSCISCDLCNLVCSGIQVNFELLAKRYKINSFNQHSPYLGYYREIYLAKSTHLGIVRRATAGGVVTGLLYYGFDKSLIDGAVVVRMSKDKPIRAEGYIAQSIEELHGSPQSKYQPIALLRLLRGICKYEKLAIVGVGCHVESLRKWGLIDSELRKRVRYVIGLYCANGNNAIEGTEFIMKKMGFNHVKYLSYRDGEYPGSFLFDDGIRQARLRKDQYKWFHLLFTEKRCMQCIDYTNELADISVGDSYSLSDDDKKGKSIVILRSEFGQHFFHSAVGDGCFFTETVSANEVIKSQRYQFNISKNAIPKHIKRRKAKEKPTPIYLSNSIVKRSRKFHESFESFFTLFIFNTRKIWILFFKLTPFSLFKLVSSLSRRD